MIISEMLQFMSIPLNDSGQVTYPEAMRLQSLNAALRSLVTIRPDSNSKMVNVALVAGALQSFPDDCEHFLDLCYQVETVDGVDRLGVPLRLVDRKDLDNNDPLWPTNVGIVEELAVDDRFPDVFWVNPVPADGTQRIEIGIAEQAPVITSSADPWPLKVKFIQPAIEYALYWLFGRDSTVVGNAQNASMHLQAFMSLLGIDGQNISNISPVTPDYKEA